MFNLCGQTIHSPIAILSSCMSRPLVRITLSELPSVIQTNTGHRLMYHPFTKRTQLCKNLSPQLAKILWCTGFLWCTYILHQRWIHHEPIAQGGLNRYETSADDSLDISDMKIEQIPPRPNVDAPLLNKRYKALRSFPNSSSCRKHMVKQGLL